jgi:hypothetical protein
MAASIRFSIFSVDLCGILGISSPVISALGYQTAEDEPRSSQRNAE